MYEKYPSWGHRFPHLARARGTNTRGSGFKFYIEANSRHPYYVPKLWDIVLLWVYNIYYVTLSTSANTILVSTGAAD